VCGAQRCRRCLSRGLILPRGCDCARGVHCERRVFLCRIEHLSIGSYLCIRRRVQWRRAAAIGMRCGKFLRGRSFCWLHLRAWVRVCRVFNLDCGRGVRGRGDVCRYRGCGCAVPRGVILCGKHWRNAASMHLRAGILLPGVKHHHDWRAVHSWKLL
jgi:hypothetical protein